MGFKDILSNRLIQLGMSIKKPHNPKTSKQVSVLIDSIKERRSIWRKEVIDWQMGREAYYDEYTPTTWQLQDVYHDIMLDGQLTTVTEDRKLRLLNKELVVYGKDKKIDEFKTELINDQEWVFDLLNECLDSIFYGYSLVHLRTGKSLTGKTVIQEPYLIPRGYVSPHHKMILKNENDPTVGVEWSKFPNELLYAQMYNAVGILEKASPLTILKRHSWGSWDEFEQIFGIPIRVAKYALGNEKLKQEIAGWLEEMGSAAYGVFPKEAEIDIKENQKSDAFNVFFKKIERVDAGLSKLILHQTGTTDEKAYVGSAEVHENTLEQVTLADERKSSLILKRLPYMLFYWGYGFDGTERIGYKKTINPNKQITIDSQLMSGGVRLKTDYIERTYGSEVEGYMSDRQAPADEKKALKLLNLYYRTHCCDTAHLIGEDFNPIGASLVKRYINQLFKRKGINPATEQLFWREVYKNLSGGMDKGYNQELQYNYADFEMLANLKTNAAVFSVFKNHSFKNELVKLLIDENGDVRSWSSFKKEALQLSDTYNKTWLKTEYDHAVSASHMASKWQDFQSRKHLYPNLKYITVGDNRVRELHSKWHNLVLPIEHKFWDTHLPPNDWGCRCDVIQTDEPIDTKNLEVDDMPNLPKQFNINYGKQGKAFNENHPYFKTHIEDTRALREDVERYKLKAPEFIYLKDKKVNVSAWADRNDLPINLKMASLINKKLKTDIKIRPHLEVQKLKNPEFEWDGLFGDLKEVSSIANIRNVLDDLKKQCYVKGANNAYFGVIHLLAEPLDIALLKRELNRKIHQNRGKHLKGLYFVRGNKTVYLSREDIVNRDYTKLLKIQ